MTVRWLLVVATCGGLALAGCGDYVRDDELEAQLEGLAAKELRGLVKPAEIAIDCPGDIKPEVGVEFECATEAGTESGVARGVITHEDGGYRYLGLEFTVEEPAPK